MSRISIGFFIRRTWKSCPPGKTLVERPHVLYHTRDEADLALAFTRADGFDSRFDYDVAEAWMHVEDTQTEDANA